MATVVVQAPQASKPTWLYVAVGVAVVAALYYFFVMNKPVVPLVPVNPVPNATGGASSVLIPSGGKPAQPAPVSGPLVGSFNADNYLRVNLNGSQVYTSQIEWPEKQTITLPSVKTGDRVDFLVENVGGPGGLIGQWSWNGKTYYVNAATFPNMVVGADQNIWGDAIRNSFPSSVWMWSKDNCENCVNTFSWIAQ